MFTFIAVIATAAIAGARYLARDAHERDHDQDSQTRSDWLDAQRDEERLHAEMKKYRN